MEILVCIKQVPDDSVNIKMNPATNAPDLDIATPIVNAFDTYALEMATRLKEAVGDSTITVVSVGPDKAKDAIKTCLAVGASKGYVVKADATDTISTADALAKAVAKIEEAEGVKFDIIFCGKESTDCASGQVGTMLAEDLDVPVVPNLIDIEMVDGGVSAKQETEEGYRMVEAGAPCVVTVTKPEYDPRYPTIKNKMAARKKPIGDLGLGDLAELDKDQVGEDHAKVKMIKLYEPQKKEAGIKIQEETDEDSAVKAVAMMADAKVF